MDDWYALLEAGADADEKSEIARGIFKTELERLTRLEAKLDGQRTILTAVSPVTILAIGAAFGDRNLAALALASVAAVHLVVAFLLALRGSAAVPLFVLTTDAYRALLAGTRRPRAVVAAVELAAADANQLRGFWLNNWLACAQNSAVWAVITTACALVLLLASRFPPK